MKKPLAILLLLFSFVSAQETIAVIEFEGLGISQAEAKALTDEFEINLTSIGDYTLVERGKVEEVLQEQAFNQTGCTSDECAVEVGMLLSVKNIVLGSISKVGRTYSVNAKIVDVQTGEIIKTASYKFRGLIDELLVSGMAEVVFQLTGKKVKSSLVFETLRPEKINNDDYKRSYIEALSAYNDGNYESATQGFRRLVTGDPSHKLADNSQYWLAESYYALKNYKRAILEFEKVFQFKEQDKWDDTQLKLGICYQKIGNFDKARAAFQKLVDHYPGSEYYQRAKQYLRQL